MKVCPKCGSNVEKNFCPQCGFNLMKYDNLVSPDPINEYHMGKVAECENEEVYPNEMKEEFCVEVSENNELVAKDDKTKKKSHKKKFIVGIAFICVIALISIVGIIGSTSVENAVVGKWDMEGYSENDDIKAASFSTVVFKKDHTGEFELGSSEHTFDWEFTKEGDDIILYTMKLDDGQKLVAGIGLDDSTADSNLMLIRISEEYDLLYKRVN